jgi:hypothetical protein
MGRRVAARRAGGRAGDVDSGIGLKVALVVEPLGEGICQAESREVENVKEIGERRRLNIGLGQTLGCFEEKGDLLGKKRRMGHGKVLSCFEEVEERLMGRRIVVEAISAEGVVLFLLAFVFARRATITLASSLVSPFAVLTPIWVASIILITSRIHFPKQRIRSLNSLSYLLQQLLSLSSDVILSTFCGLCRTNWSLGSFIHTLSTFFNPLVSVLACRNNSIRQAFLFRLSLFSDFLL